MIIIYILVSELIITSYWLLSSYCSIMKTDEDALYSMVSHEGTMSGMNTFVSFVNVTIY